MHWATSKILYQIVTTANSSEVSQTVETMISIHKSFASHMPITLLSIIVDLLEIEGLLEQRGYEALEVIMSAYSKSDVRTISDELLLGTEEWVTVHLGIESDLLKRWNEQIEELLREKLIKESIYCQNAIDFTDELRQKRESIFYKL